MLVNVGKLKSSKSSGPSAPIITAISPVPDSLYFVVTWTTQVPSTSQVQYGTTTGYGSSTTLDPTLVTSHSVVVTGLTDNVLYHFRVKSSTHVDGSSPTISLDQTTTTYHLTLPIIQTDPLARDESLVGPYAGKPAPFADGLADQNSTAFASDNIANPSQWNNVHLNAATLQSFTFKELWIWVNDLQLANGSSLISDGGAGNDGLDECCTFWQGGDGGPGASGGGGGAASDNIVAAQGGFGGTNGSNGEGGQTIGLGAQAGQGGSGYGYTYDGSDILISLVPQAGGSGGDANGQNAAAGGGGGGSGYLQGIVCNSFTNASTGHLSSMGGQPGNGSFCSSGNPGTDGSVILFTRKYDGSLGNLYATQGYIVEILGGYQNGFTVGTIYDATVQRNVAFNHLDHP